MRLIAREVCFRVGGTSWDASTTINGIRRRVVTCSGWQVAHE